MTGSRRLLIALLALCCGLILVGGAGSVAASVTAESSEVTVSIDDVEFDEAGETETLTVDVTGAENGIGGYDLELSVDTDVVKITDFETPGGFDDSAVSDDGGTLTLAVALAGGTLDGPDETIADVTVEAVADGVSPLDFSSTDDVVIVDEDTDGYSHTFDSGTATVGDQEPVDVTAAFDFDPQEPTVGESISFDASDSTAETEIVDYRFDFGDGNDAEGEQVSYEYDEPGEYIVTLTVEEENGYTDSTDRQVSVSEADEPDVTAEFDFDPAEPEVDEDITFDASDSTADNDIDTYTWEFGDGTDEMTTAETILHSYDSADNFAVTLTVEDSEGNTDSTTQTVTVSESDEPEVTAAFEFDPQDPDVDEDITFDASGSSADEGIASYSWEFGDGTEETTDEETINHSYDAEDEYEVTLTVEDENGNTDTTTQTVSVTEDVDPVAASFNFAPPNPETNELVNFDASTSTGDIVEYRWDFGDGATDETTFPDTDTFYLSGGEYEVELTVEGEQGQTDTTTRTIIVEAGPEPLSAALSAETEQVEVGETVTFNASESTGDIVEYRFDFDDGTTVETNDSVTTHSFDEQGEYAVTVTVEDEEGDTDEDTVFVSVFDPDAVSASLELSTPEVEVGQQVSLNAMDSDAAGDIVEYRWDTTGDGEIDQITEEAVITPIYDEPGEYEITLTVVDEFDQTASTTVTLTVTADPPEAALNVSPDEDIIGEEFLIEAGDSTGNIVEYQWAFGDGEETTGTDPTVRHGYDEPGEYEITLTVVDQFNQTDSATATVSVITVPPEADFVADPSETQVGGEIRFNASISEGDIVEFQWEFGDGVTETSDADEPSLLYAYADPGTYTVELTVVDDRDREDTTTQEIEILESDDGTDGTDDDGVDDTDGVDDADDDGTGFGLVVAVVGLLGAAYLVGRRVV